MARAGSVGTCLPRSLSQERQLSEPTTPIFLNGPMQLAQQQLRKSLKAVRKLRRSVLLGVSCTLATSLEYSRIGGLQLSCELLDRNMGR